MPKDRSCPNNNKLKAPPPPYSSILQLCRLLNYDGGCNYRSCRHVRPPPSPSVHSPPWRPPPKSEREREKKEVIKKGL
ncbi:hypothetical protein MIMGU_mgv1a017396mg [Erythranthe guttata]|uniref:Uncharacterized protein n=1 Tax=Erythranthe guttata TaxID=4155 RepID=A0A022RI59_ERYGU|nr:hypothetical protein MIMGU_mgv1a017396mg [Erythranthe guttata]